MNNLCDQWIVSGQFPSLADDEIHVWAKAIDAGDKLAKLWNVLTSAEKEKANQFKFPHLKNRFIISQGTLRFLLGKYLKLNPETIVFAHNQYGKPYVKDFADQIRFNLSHANDLVLFAFTLRHEVGIDVELIRDNFSVAEISRRFFHPDEVAALLALPEIERRHAFFNFWVKKEAFIKAIGLGLFYALDKFKVNFSQQQTLVWEEDTEEKSLWFLQELPVSTEYRAAVVNAARMLAVKFFQF